MSHLTYKAYAPGLGTTLTPNPYVFKRKFHPDYERYYMGGGRVGKRKAGGGNHMWRTDYALRYYLPKN